MVKVFLDSGDPVQVHTYHDKVSGFTSNPSLMKGQNTNYREFAKTYLAAAGGKPVSFEVFADNMRGIEDQVREISSWGENVYVKIPVTTSNGQSTGHLIRNFSMFGTKLNVTAVFTMEQIRTVAHCLHPETPSIISIFAGRIADTGRDPTPFITAALHAKHSKTEILWASTREVYNYYQAEQCGADIITMPPSLIEKLSLKGKDLTEYSRETVEMFFRDGQGLSL